MKPGAISSPILPLPLPTGDTERVILVAVRRMAAHGIRDAGAANLLIGAFGLHFRIKLALIRALVVEIARCSRRSIAIAPCCAMRMTHDEGLILSALALAGTGADDAADAMRHLTGTADCGAALSVATYLGGLLPGRDMPAG